MQYAHARICSVLRASAGGGDLGGARAAPTSSLLAAPSEAALMRKLAEYPDDAGSRGRRISRRTTWPSTCATWPARFHSYYAAERFLVDDDDALTRARLALLAATRQVLRNALAVLGVGAPEQMPTQADHGSTS